MTMTQMLRGSVLLWIGLIFLPALALGTTLQATFSMNGIKGTVIFHQQAEGDPSSIMVNLTDIKETLSWSIHRLPMIYDGGVKSCHSNLVGGVYDLDANMSSGGYHSKCIDSSKDDKFENCVVGDLSEKHGNLSVGMNWTQYTDQALKLSGHSSINGRTLVLTRALNGTPLACALITTPEPMFTAKAVFSAPVAGIVYFRQLDEQSDTFVFVNIFRVSTMKNVTLNWKIDTTMMSDTFSSSSELCKPDSGTYNPYSISNEESCNSTYHMRCSVGDLSRKHGRIRASEATAMEAQASAKRVFTDSNLPLKGAKNILGRSLVFYTEEEGFIACAKITIVQPKRAIARFRAATHKGIEGSFVFTQATPFDPTTADIQLSGLDKYVQGYHVHEHPNPEYKHVTRDKACSGSVAGGHFNPHGVIGSLSPASRAGTDDQYEVGDLSGKYGSFMNMMTYTKRHVDYNLPLFGYESVLGRCIVIHGMKKDGNKRHVCANLRPKLESQATFFMKTKTEFKGPSVYGMILIDQYMSEEENGFHSNTMIYIDLKYKNTSQKSMRHKWHIHMKPFLSDAMANRKRCGSMGGHFNPHKVNLKGDYRRTCCRTNMLRCEAGDLSGKHGLYNIGMGPKYYTDTGISLFGKSSIVGRGVVVHAENAGKLRLACGNTIPDPSLHEEKSLEFIEEAAFDKRAFVRRIASALFIPAWRVTYVRTMRGKYNNRCLMVKFGIVGRADQTELPSATFDDIVNNSPEELKEFTPSQECVSPLNSSLNKPSPKNNKGSFVRVDVLMMLVLLMAGRTVL